MKLSTFYKQKIKQHSKKRGKNEKDKIFFFMKLHLKHLKTDTLYQLYA